MGNGSAMCALRPRFPMAKSVVVEQSRAIPVAVEDAFLRTLYITSARVGYTETGLTEQPHAGDIFACVPGVTGRLPFLFGA